MKLPLYLYKCKHCSNAFKAPELPGEPYGEFIMRSEEGCIAYLLALDSEIYSEFYRILESLYIMKNIDKLDKAKLIRKSFGIACDLAPDGSLYQITNFPTCPKCKSNKMLSWKPVLPIEYVDAILPSVTHNQWTLLTYEEKQNKISNFIRLISS